MPVPQQLATHNDIMSTPVCRLLPFAIADGPHNMAADETMLETAVGGVASLRFYGWSPPTVSLGYFQPHRVREQDPGVASLPWVRRPSGGATLVHHHEVTYALALPAGLPWQTEEPWSRRMHALIARVLAGFRIAAGLYEPKEGPPFAGFLCFDHFTPGDLMIGDAKVVGSAQRRQRQALLQHGGILLATSPHTPNLPGIHERAGYTLAADELAAALELQFAADTGWRLEHEDWSAAEAERIEKLAAEKYGRDAWNCKR
jgi:lipoate-protein ligase A